MYVCLCRGVTDERVVEVVREGAGSVAAVGRACGAGRTCGGCRPEIRRLLSQTRLEGPDATWRDGPSAVGSGSDVRAAGVREAPPWGS